MEIPLILLICIMVLFIFCNMITLHICLSDKEHKSIKFKWKSKIVSFKIEITRKNI